MTAYVYHKIHVYNKIYNYLWHQDEIFTFGIDFQLASYVVYP